MARRPTTAPAAAAPFLPGMTFDNPAARAAHHKTQLFGFKNGIPVQAAKAPSPVDPLALSDLLEKARALQLQTKSAPASASSARARTASAQSAGSSAHSRTGLAALTARIPAEPAVLLFTAYFTETVAVGAEAARVRHVKIYVYTKDDTIEVYEPAVPNSGLAQGTLLSRQKVPKPHRPGQYYTWKDLNLGLDVVFFSRVYHVCDCNASTEMFLYTNGVDLGEREGAPVDVYTHTRRAVDHPDISQTTPNDFDKYHQVLCAPFVAIAGSISPQD